MNVITVEQDDKSLRKQKTNNDGKEWSNLQWGVLSIIPAQHTPP